MRKNIKTLFRGLWRTVCGTTVAIGIGSAGYGYTLVPAAGGYEGVLVAIGSSALLMLSLFLMWSVGGGVHPIRKEGR